MLSRKLAGQPQDGTVIPRAPRDLIDGGAAVAIPRPRLEIVAILGSIPLPAISERCYRVLVCPWAVGSGEPVHADFDQIPMPGQFLSHVITLFLNLSRFSIG